MKIIFLVLLAISVAIAKPAAVEKESSESIEKEQTNSGPFPKCYDLVCPAGTVGCSRKAETSKDRKSIVTDIQCEDFKGRVLKSDTSTKPNPDEHAIIRSFSYSRVYSFTSGSEHSHSTGSRKTVHNNDENDEIETFN